MRVALVAALLGLALLAAPAAAQSPGRVSGWVTDESGSPVEGASVSLVPDGPTTTTDSEGHYLLEAAEGHYLLRATAFNRSQEAAVDVAPGAELSVNLTVRSGAGAGTSIDPFPFVFLALSMVAVVVGGFYVNKRMSETGLAFDKSVMGGAPARKPFRRRRRPKQPPPSP